MTTSTRSRKVVEPTGFVANTRARWRHFATRADRQILRLQGRTDTPTFDRWAPWVIFIVVGLVYLWFAAVRYYSVDMVDRLALAMNATWLIDGGYQPISTLVNGQPSGENYLALTSGLLIYPVAAVTMVFPRVGALLTLQSFALALTVVPLWRIARGPGNLRVGATAAIVFAFIVYTPVNLLNLAGFHLEVFAIPALVAAVLFGLTRQDWRMWLCIAIVLAARADLSLAVMGIGILLMIERRRSTGLSALLVGGGWLLFTTFVVHPYVSIQDSWPALNAYAEFGSTPFGVIIGIFSHPIEFMKLVFSNNNFVVLVTLLAPVLFLPAVAMRYLFPALPLYVLYVGADVPEGLLRESAQTAPMTAFIFVATVFAMKKSGRILVERVNVDRRVIAALLLTSTVFFIRDSPTSPYRSPWSWLQRTANDEAIVAMAERIPRNSPVRASPRALPLLAERFAVYQLDITAEPNDDAAAAVKNVDYLLFDGSDAALYDSDGDYDLFGSTVEIAGWKLVDYYDPRNEAGELLPDRQVRLWRYVGGASQGPIVVESTPSDVPDLLEPADG